MGDTTSSFSLDEYYYIGNSRIKFFRITPSDIKITLQEIFTSLSNLSWIEGFDEEYVRSSFNERAVTTLKKIAENIIEQENDSVTKDSGEYIVSELSRTVIIQELNYTNIPLAELIKEQVSGNPGFDFYSENNQENIILFGEAKYVANTNAYGKALKQIVRFEENKKDVIDSMSIEKFCKKESLKNHAQGNKGFIAAFSSNNIKTEKLIENISKNENFKKAILHNELICVAVNI